MDAGILGLREWRQRKGISLDAIAASTKLSVRHLDAIESGDFRKLPGGIYNTSYIRQYARAIDFDEAEILAYYHGKETTSAEARATLPIRNRLSLFQA
jgi:cytoskeletal protein RodZ